VQKDEMDGMKKKMQGEKLQALELLKDRLIKVHCTAEHIDLILIINRKTLIFGVLVNVLL